MAIETFAWRIQAASQPTLKSKDNIRRVQFGDGYAQVSGNGINNETLSYEFSFLATRILLWKFINFCVVTKPRRFLLNRQVVN